MVWIRAGSSISFPVLTVTVDQIKSLFHIFFELWEFKFQIIALLFSGYIFIGISVSEWINSAIVEYRSYSLLQDKQEQC